MTGPLIPYVTIPELHIFGPVSIKPFGTLVAIGVYVGSELARRHAQRSGLDLQRLSTFVFYILLGGFIGGHVLDSIFYHPDELARSPLSLLKIWAGQSSFGGFTGAFIGLIVFWRKIGPPVLPYADIVASAFPVGWVFGRMGCSVAHDHPGIASNAWFAVAYPGGGRFDLGLYEMLFTIPLALTFLYLARKPRPAGFFLGLMCMAYAPVRFAFDFLRVPEGTMNGEADLRYGGLTPAQWGCFLLLSAGVYFAIRAARSLERDEKSVVALARPGSAVPDPSRAA